MVVRRGGEGWREGGREPRPNGGREGRPERDPSPKD